MATINITIRDSVLLAATEAVANMGGYTATIPDPADPLLTIPNVSKEVFLKQQIKAWLRNQTIENAQRTAMTAAAASVEAE